MICAPFLITDAIGFFERIIWVHNAFHIQWDGTIWANADPIINIIPTILALAYLVIYIYRR